MPPDLHPTWLLVANESINQQFESPAENKQQSFITCAQFGIVVGVLALFMNVPMSTFYNPFLQGFVWLWLGVSAGAAAKFQSSKSQAFSEKSIHAAAIPAMGLHQN